MSENCSSQMTKIMAAIKEGHLTKNEMEGRLKAAIDHEYAHGNPPNAALINACEDLLLHLEGDELSFTSSNVRLHQLIEQNGCKESHSRSWAMRPLRLAVAFMVVIAISFGIGSAVRWQWFDIGSTPDEQQYFVKGQEVSVDAIQRAIAEHEETPLIILDDMAELSFHLGFEPMLPRHVNSVWKAVRSTIFFFPDYIQLCTTYIHQENDSRTMNYTQNYYTNINNAYLSFEQKCEGERVALNGQSVYVSINMDRPTACWQNEMTVYAVSGDFDYEDIPQILSELNGGEQNE